MTRLEVDGERAFLDGTLQGLVAVIYENERPIKGLAGLMDWRARGQISGFIRAGKITGKLGEAAYIPIEQPDRRIMHVILVGGGQLAKYARRGLLPDDGFAVLRNSLSKLKIQRIGISQTEFGGLGEDYLADQLKDAPYTVLP